MSHAAYSAALRESALLLAKRLTMQFIVGRFPFFAWTVPNFVLGMVVGKVLEIAITKTELALFFEYVDFRTSRQGRAFWNSVETLRDAQGRGDAKEIEQAEAWVIRDFENLVKLNRL